MAVYSGRVIERPFRSKRGKDLNADFNETPLAKEIFQLAQLRRRRDINPRIEESFLFRGIVMTFDLLGDKDSRDDGEEKR